MLETRPSDFRQGQRSQRCSSETCRRTLDLDEPRVDVVFRNAAFSRSTKTTKIGVYHIKCFQSLLTGSVKAMTRNLPFESQIDA